MSNIFGIIYLKTDELALIISCTWVSFESRDAESMFRWRASRGSSCPLWQAAAVRLQTCVCDNVSIVTETLCFCDKEIKVLSKEMQSVLIALLSLLSIYVTGVLAIFIVLSKVSQICLSCPNSLEYYHKKITLISLHVSLTNSSPN